MPCLKPSEAPVNHTRMDCMTKLASKTVLCISRSWIGDKVVESATRIPQRDGRHTARGNPHTYILSCGRHWGTIPQFNRSTVPAS